MNVTINEHNLLHNVMVDNIIVGYGEKAECEKLKSELDKSIEKQIFIKNLMKDISHPGDPK